MSTETSKLVFDVSSASSVAIKVVQRLRALAKELHLEDYIDSDGFEKKVKPPVPDSGGIDATRRYEMHLAEYKAEVKALKELREAGEKSITPSAYEQMCVMMGRSTSDVLEAKEIIDGVKKHFATITRADEDKITNELQIQWAEGVPLTRHVIAQASKVADLESGGKKMPDAVGKATLWRSLARVTENPLYSGLTDVMSVQLDTEDVTYPVFTAKLLEELRKARYAGLNADTKAEAARESVLALKEKQSRDEKFKEKQKANKLKYAAHSLEDQCPVHPNNEHTWGSCSHYTGKKYFAKKNK
jgi:hypothetical protein